MPRKADCDGGAGSTRAQLRANCLKALTRVLDADAGEHTNELIATDARDHVVGTQGGSQGVGHGDEERVPCSMTCGVVRGFETVYVDVSSYELSAVALGAIELASDGSQPGATAAYARQLIGP